MPSLLCPLFRSKKKHKTAATDGKAASLASKSLVPGKRDGNPDGMSPDRSRSTMDTARLTVLSLETNRRGNFRDDDSSLPTIDPDYNPTNDCFSLSDAGGTIGSQSLAATTAFGSAARPPASYLEPGFYHHAPYHPAPYGPAPPALPPPRHAPPPSSAMSPPPTTATLHEPSRLLEIYAPPGKLGVVIDVPPQSATPLVHAIKDTCPIRNEIFVGDRLLAVDDQDVTAMTAMEVSRLISRKSGQRARKLTVRRDGRMILGGGRMGDGHARRVHDPMQLGMQY